MHRTNWQQALKTIFETIRDCIDLLSPTALQTVAALAPIGAYFVMDQGADVLSRLGEDLTATHENQSCLGVVWFIVANVVASISIWWTSRVALSLRFDGHHPSARLGREIADPLVSWWPRILGIIPTLIIATAFFWRAWDYKPALAKIELNLWGLYSLGFIHMGLAGLLLTFFIKRRRWLASKGEAPPQPKFASFRQMATQNSVGFWFHLGLLIACIAFILLVWVFTLNISQAVQAPAMFSFSAAAWVVAGTWLMHLRASTGFPVLFCLVVLFYSASFNNDNHHIRTSAPLSQLTIPEPKSVEDAFGEWLNALPPLGPRADGKPRVRPVFVVATEGGGIRAAYWTADVLGSCQEPFDIDLPGGVKLPPGVSFADSTFAISGVSGGSVGGAVFDALLHDNKTNLVHMSEAILGQDHLSPLLTGLLFPETIQRFWPWVLPLTDRAAVFENSLETAYSIQTDGCNTLAAPFTSLWTIHPRLPHLFLNSTRVESGQRIIFSDLPIKANEFMDAMDASSLVYEDASGRPLDIPLSTAAHASARFTYTNPQGTLKDGTHFVDGGYFEDSGATTAVEIIKIMEKVLAERKAAMVQETATQQTADPVAKDTIIPVLIIISNSFPPDGMISPDDHPKPLRSLIDVLAPPEALLNARSARGNWARFWARHQIVPAGLNPPSDSAPSGVAPAKGMAKDEALVHIDFGLIDEGIPLPLGWSLSKKAAAAMDYELLHDENTKSRQKVCDLLINSIAP